MSDEKLLRERYRVESRLGQSDRTTTYRAVDTRSGRSCVIKELAVTAATLPKAVELFEREARVLSRLNHSRIPRFLDCFSIETESGPRIYLVQELIAGRNLAQVVSEGRHFTETEVIRAALEVAKILRYLHSQDPAVLHRDIKPSNILLTPDGTYVLVDFGAVREQFRQLEPPARAGATIVGTYGYVPLEQFEGNAVPASDIYGLGATLIFLLSHKEPMELETDLFRLEYRPHVRISDRFAAVLDKMITPRVEERYQTAEELLRDLEALLEGRAPVRSRRKIRRVYWLVPALSLVVLALGWIGYRFLTAQITLPGHSSKVYAVGFSRDGKRLLSLSRQEIQVWEVGSWRRLARLVGEFGGWHFGLALGPFGNQVITGGETPGMNLYAADHLILWNAETWEAVSLLEGQSTAQLRQGDPPAKGQGAPLASLVDALAMSPDGSMAVSAEHVRRPNPVSPSHSTVTIHDLAGGQRQVFSESRSVVTAVAFSPDGTHIALATRLWNDRVKDYVDGRIVIRDARTTQPLWTAPVLADAVAYSPDGDRLIVNSTHNEDYTVWNLRNGRPERTLSGQPIGYSFRSFTAGAVHPRATWVACPNSRIRALPLIEPSPIREIRLWDYRTGDLVHTWVVRSDVKNYVVTSLAISPDGDWLAAGLGNDFAGEVKIVRMRSDGQGPRR